ncbi:MAG: hypothetical protein ACXVWX_08635, partial [Nocardioides sp.]
MGLPVGADLDAVDELPEQVLHRDRVTVIQRVADLRDGVGKEVGVRKGGSRRMQLGGEVDVMGAELVSLGGQVVDPFGAQVRRHG